MAAGTHALGLCGCEAGADHVDKKFDGEPMRQHDDGIDRVAALSGASARLNRGSPPRLRVF